MRRPSSGIGTPGLMRRQKRKKTMTETKRYDTSAHRFVDALLELEQYAREDLDVDGMLSAECINVEFCINGNAENVLAYLLRQYLAEPFGRRERSAWLRLADLIGPNYIDALHNRAVYVKREADFRASA